MWEQIATAIGIKAVEKFFDGRNKQDTDVVGVGLAVGYFYNFLDPVSQAIDREEFEIYSQTENSEPPQFRSEGQFTSEKTLVQIIVPKRLNVEAFKRCEAEFKDKSKGFLFLPQNKRYYGVNYFTPSAGELTIIDLARPIMAAKRYYEDILKLDTHNESDERWLKIQQAELTAFKESLRRLQARGYGALVNQLDFRERG